MTTHHECDVGGYWWYPEGQHEDATPNGSTPATATWRCSMAARRNSSTAFQKRAREVVARDGMICGICNHGNAITCDHIIAAKDWPTDPTGKLLPGLDDPSNLRAAHGSRGVGEHNPCMECDRRRWPKGRMCNQTRGAGRTEAPQEIHSRSW